MLTRQALQMTVLQRGWAFARNGEVTVNLDKMRREREIFNECSDYIVLRRNGPIGILLAHVWT